MLLWIVVMVVAHRVTLINADLAVSWFDCSVPLKSR